MIGSASNRQVKEIVKLQKQAKRRRESSLFVAEGIKLVLEAGREGAIEKIYMSEEILKNPPDGLEELLCAFPHEETSAAVFRRMADTATAQGVLATAKIPSYSLDGILNDVRHMWLILDGLSDPGNLGAAVRAAEGAGMAGVVMGTGTADMFSPKAVRATMGAALRVPYVYVDSVSEAIEAVKEKGCPVYGADMRGSKLYYDVDYRRGAGIVIGNEAAGISPEAAGHLTGRVRIPMEGEIESLNAASAAAVIMYESLRQRRTAPVVAQSGQMI